VPEDPDEAVSFQGSTTALRGFVRRPSRGVPTAALILSHARRQDMDDPILMGLVERASELGIWTLRYNFSFRELMAEPSVGHTDEIEDLRAAVSFAREASGIPRMFLAGKGLGAWASVAVATDGDIAGAILLGLSYEGQPERRIALERLGEFEIPTLVLVGSASERTDLPALRAVLESLPLVNLEVIEGADHRLEDREGHPLVESILMKCEAWLRLRLEEERA